MPQWEETQAAAANAALARLVRRLGEIAALVDGGYRMARCQHDELFHPALEERITSMRSAAARRSTRSAKASSISRALLAFKTWSSSPSARAGASASFVSTPAF